MGACASENAMTPSKPSPCCIPPEPQPGAAAAPPVAMPSRSRESGLVPLPSGPPQIRSCPVIGGELELSRSGRSTRRQMLGERAPSLDRLDSCPPCPAAAARTQMKKRSNNNKEVEGSSGEGAGPIRLQALPSRARQTSVMKFLGMSPERLLRNLRGHLETYPCDVVSLSRSARVGGKILVCDEVLEFEAKLYSLPSEQQEENEDDDGAAASSGHEARTPAAVSQTDFDLRDDKSPKEDVAPSTDHQAQRSASHHPVVGLYLELIAGDRLIWLHFFMDAARALGGHTDPRLKEFVARFSFGHLGGAAQPQVAPDASFAQGCCSLVGSRCTSSKVEGLKGLKLALATCEPGDALSQAIAPPVHKALGIASDSKNPTVLRLASALLLVAVRMFRDDALMASALHGSFVQIKNAIALKQELLGGRRPDLETRQTLQNVEEVRRITSERIAT